MRVARERIEVPFMKIRCELLQSVRYRTHGAAFDEVAA